MRKKETNNHQSSFDVDLKEYWSSRKKIDGSLLWKDQSLDCKGQKRAQFSVFMTDGKSNLTRIYRPTFISFFGGHFITQWKKIVANRLVHNVKWGGVTWILSQFHIRGFILSPLLFYGKITSFKGYDDTML